MKRMFDEKHINDLFKKPGLHDWEERHTGTGAMTQDGSVIASNDTDSINANTSTVYQFDHFDKASGKYIFKLASNQFTFPSVAGGSLKKNGVKFDIDDDTLWDAGITVSYIAPLIGSAGIYAIHAKNAPNGGGYELRNCFAGQQQQLYSDGSLEIASYFENGFLATLKNIFLEAGCSLTDDGYQAIIPGKYLEMVSADTAKITLLPQEIAIAPAHEPVFRLSSTEE